MKCLPVGCSRLTIGRTASSLLGDLMKHNLQFMVRCIMFIYCGHSVLDTGLKKKGFTVFLLMFRMRVISVTGLEGTSIPQL